MDDFCYQYATPDMTLEQAIAHNDAEAQRLRLESERLTILGQADQAVAAKLASLGAERVAMRYRTSPEHWELDKKFFADHDRDAEIIRMAKATSEGVEPFDDFVRELEARRGEHLELSKSSV